MDIQELYNYVDKYTDSNYKIDWRNTYISPLILDKIKQDYYKQKHKELEDKLNKINN